MYFIRDLSIIVRKTRAFVDKKFSDKRLGFAEQLIIGYLHFNDGCAQAEIANYFLVDRGSIAKSIDKLQKLGCVKRKANPENHRENMIFLSGEGNDLYPQAKTLQKEWERIAYKGISKKDLEIANKTLGIIAQNMENLE
ncbi:MAG: MarR family transcriptional regulator [Coriobacteriales bacterium]|nr:MarR family transcriptional regulator [Coriobacteriales bacterium]